MQPARRVLRSASSSSAAAATAAHGPFFLNCRGCRRLLQQQQHRRAFSHTLPRLSVTASTDATAPPVVPPAEPPAAPAPRGLARLTSRRLISVSGPDAARYLQGVITANLFPGASSAKSASPDLHHLRRDAGFYAAFLTAQGRVLHDVFIYRDPRRVSEDDASGKTSWLVEVDAAEAGRLQQHIRRYKLRARFDVRLVDEDEVGVWQAWDDSASLSFSPSPSPSPATLLTIIPDPRAPNLGHRILTFSSSSSSTNAEETIHQSLPSATPPPPPLVPEVAYTLRRYLHGIPEGPHELPPAQALPHESNMDLVPDAIDFRKGCYVGQELTVRTEHRGVVRKRVLPCLLYPAEDGEGPASGEAPQEVSSVLAGLYRPYFTSSAAAGGNESGSHLTASMLPTEASIGRANKSGRSAGKWLSGIGNVGLALCRLEIMTDVVLPGETGGTGASYSPGDEFVVGLGSDGSGEGGKVKIKAFVPEWLRRGLAEKGGR
ncbi:hypothetical protein VTJ49DRAFT_4865 [Mycothermus thermophilus]|uniref:Iron-sulfur cluster assembly factor IBA57 homolog, mitochondrial n=1 Tax=Humicola insolens TaxID=85995 RepID=A0ABR3V4I7_HUMIN